jgi:hypothetical protein
VAGGAVKTGYREQVAGYREQRTVNRVQGAVAAVGACW